MNWEEWAGEFKTCMEDSKVMQTYLKGFLFKGDGKLVLRNASDEHEHKHKHKHQHPRLCFRDAKTNLGMVYFRNKTTASISFTITDGYNTAWLEFLYVLQDKIYLETGYLLWATAGLQEREDYKKLKHELSTVSFSSAYPKTIDLIAEYYLMPRPHCNVTDKYPRLKVFINEDMASELRDTVAGEYDIAVSLVGVAIPPAGFKITFPILKAKHFFGYAATRRLGKAQKFN